MKRELNSHTKRKSKTSNHPNVISLLSNYLLVPANGSLHMKSEHACDYQKGSHNIL